MTGTLRAHLASALGGAYALERELGGGGMSRVFVAQEIALRRQVVIKVLAPDVAGAVDAQRFRQEIQFAATLQHPHIVPLLTAGEVDGVPWFTMPFVRGSSLRDRLGQGGALPVGETVAIVRDVVRAVAYAHRNGIVHRDIKPENVLLSDDGALVTDFGIAKAIGNSVSGGWGSRPGATGLGIVMGTPAYMAPEQAVGDTTADHRVDIWAVGAMAYELLLGTPPFQGGSPTQIMQAVVHDPPVPLGERRPDLPTALTDLVMWCLAKDPAARPQTAEDVLRALDTMHGAPTAPTRQVSGDIPTPRRWGRIAAVALGVLLLGVTGAMASIPAERRAQVWRILTRAPKPLDPQLVVVVPFVNQSGDTSVAQLGNMAADWITEGLMRAGSARVVNAADAGLADQIADKSRFFTKGGRLDAIADETGAGTVVAGSFYREGARVTFTTRIYNAVTHTMARQLDPVTGKVSEPRALVEDLRQRTMGALATMLDTGNVWIAGMREPPSYDAYLETNEGVKAFVRSDTAGAMRHYARATALDASFVQPVLLAAYNWADIGIFGRRASALDSVTILLNRLEQRMAGAIPSERATAAFISAQVSGDAERTLAAAEEGFRKMQGSDIAVIVAMTAVWANRPVDARRILAKSDPNRGVNLIAPGYWRWKIIGLHLEGRHRDELATCDEALDTFETNEDLQAMRAVALAALGREGDALAAANRLLALHANAPSPDVAEAVATIAAELRMHGKPQEGAALLTAAADQLHGLAASRDPRALAAWGRLAFEAHRDAEARAAFTAMKAVGARVGYAMAHLGLLDARGGNLASAAQWADSGAAYIELPLFRADANAVRARLLAVLGRRDEAISVLGQALHGGATFGNPLVTNHHLLAGAAELQGLRADPRFQILTSDTGSR